MSLFKKKVGGTVVGNLIRRAGDSFTGGLVSRFLPPPTAEDVKRQEEKWTAKGKKFTPDSTIVKTEPSPNLANPNNTNLSDGEKTILDYLKDYWYVVASVVAVLFYFIFKRK